MNNNSYTHFFGQDITDIPQNKVHPGGVKGTAEPLVYGLSSGGYGDWKCCSQLPHSCYDELPKTCGGHGSSCHELLFTECGRVRPPVNGSVAACLTCTRQNEINLKQAGCVKADLSVFCTAATGTGATLA